ncbi:MAG: hypothetical protein E7I68_07105 [Neisseria sp.]|nr:hypothetical protein [Neisseria sp.]
MFRYNKQRILPNRFSDDLYSHNGRQNAHLTKLQRILIVTED